ncbi:MAG: ATP-binding cassette domain-containing protein [Oscillospiraceae bacterium]|nr:ATP-binding cassette domain-containing protein [Oscillospiraceae bacterium]
MIEVKNLSKSYGSKLAVDGISFTAGESEILGFLGPNGAGKSTTMNMLTGYLSSSGGQALINGVDILEDPVRAKKDIGYLPEQPPLYLDMTVMEYLNFVYSLKKCRLPKASHLAEICSLVKITDVSKRVIRNLSKGYKQRVGLAQALVGNPRVLILDEPTVGLDPKQIIEIRTLIKKLGRNHTVILSSHILSEVQAVCDKIVVIDKGRLVANDTTEHLSQSLSADHKLTVQIEGPTKEVKALLEQIPDMEEVHLNRTIDKTIGEYELNAREGCDIRREVFKRMAARNYPILLMRSSELTLEEIFLKLTTGDFYGNTDNGGARK